MSQKDTTSSKKIAKKARSYFRKELQSTAKETGAMIGNVLKEKPKWVPMFVWMWGLGIFIKIKKKKRE